MDTLTLLERPLMRPHRKTAEEDKMAIRTITHKLFAVALLGVLATSSIGADTAMKTTYFTFSKDVQLPGVVLPAGNYLFEIVNPWTDSNVVLVASRDHSKVYAVRLTNRVERLHSRDMEARIVLGETPAGQPPSVKSWFPEGETTGREFIY